MPVERVAATDDPRLADFKNLRDPDLLRSRELFVAEGRLVVRRVLDDPRFRVESIVVNEAAHRELAAALEQTAAPPNVLIVHQRVLSEIVGFNLHRGCVALVRRPPGCSVDDVIRSASRVVALEHVANPDNIGGVFRNAAALGGEAVVLSRECADPLYRKAIRTSMAATLRVPFAVAEDFASALGRMRAAGFAIAALTLSSEAESIDAVDRQPLPPRLAIVAGNEGVGLTDAIASTTDYRLRIPISDVVDSLNVAVAVGIALYVLRPRS